MAKNIQSFQQQLFTTLQLVKSSLFAKYRKSFIGLVWVIFEPLFTVLIWIFMHLSGIIQPGESEVPYAAYVLLSTSLWGVFMTTFKATGTTLTSYARIITTVDVPYTVLVSSKVLSAGLTSLISIVLIMVMLLFVGVQPSLQWSVLFITLIPLALAGAILGLINSLLLVVALDLSKVFDYSVNFLKYATPVVYTPMVASGFLRSLSEYNPLSYMIGFPRDLVLGTSYYSVPDFLLISLVTLICFLVVYRLFILKSKAIIERLIST